MFKIVSVVVSVAALAFIGSRAIAEEDPVVARLIEVVKDKEANPDQRANACVALGKLGGKAKSAVPDMLGFLEELLKSGPDKEKLYPVGTKLRLVKVVSGLGDLGADAEAAVEPLAKLLKDRTMIPEPGQPKVNDQMHEWTAAEALGKIGTTKALAALSNALTKTLSKDADQFIRTNAVSGLQFTGMSKDADRARDAVVLLKVIAATDPLEYVQVSAKDALTAIEKDGAKKKP